MGLFRKKRPPGHIYVLKARDESEIRLMATTNNYPIVVLNDYQQRSRQLILDFPWIPPQDDFDAWLWDVGKRGADLEVIFIASYWGTPSL
jgi:hypothetical protein